MLVPSRETSVLLIAARRGRRFAEDELSIGLSALRSLSMYLSVLRSRELLYRQQRLARGVFDHPSLGFVRIDGAGQIIEANRGFSTLAGFTPEELAGTGLADAVDPRDGEQLDSLYSPAVSESGIELRLRPRSGREIWVRMRPSTADGVDGRAEEYLLLVENITRDRDLDKRQKEMNDLLELKVLVRTEELEIAMEKLQERELALRESEQRFKNVVNGMNDMIFTTDTRHMITGIFGSWHHQFSFQSEQELMGRSISSVFQLPMEMIEHSFIQLETNEKGIVEWELMDRGGGRRTYLIAISQLRDQSEHLIGYLVVGREITRRILAERALAAAKDEAERANQAKSEFLANMSHEIRTPMNAVLGYTQILHEMISDEQQLNYIGIIESAGKSLLQLINDILDLSKIEAGKMPINPAPVSLRRLLDEIHDIFRIRIDEKGLSMAIEIPDDLPPRIMVDETRLRQILVNLVGNAVKFTEEGGIRLIISYGDKGDGRISLSIAVNDTGIGIRESELEAIFDSFKQQEGQSSRKYGGTGLGLGISRKLSSLMGGSLQVNSVVGEGSSFVVALENLECDRGATAAEEIAAAEGRITLDGETILAVDDVQTNLLLLEHILHSAGAKVITAASGEEAVETAAREDIDLIVMDIRMPGMDGRTAAGLIREIPRYLDVPIIALTASVSISREQRKQNVFDGWAHKPFKAAELLRTIHQYLHRRTEIQPARNFGQRLWGEYRTLPDAVRTIRDGEVRKLLVVPAKKLSVSMTLGEAREYIKGLERIAAELEWPSLRQLAGELAAAMKTYRIDVVKEKISHLAEGFDE
jgi:PAS domain S-box-containing protein